jgi:hypothetical protein
MMAPYQFEQDLFFVVVLIEPPSLNRIPLIAFPIARPAAGAIAPNPAGGADCAGCVG